MPKNGHDGGTASRLVGKMLQSYLDIGGPPEADPGIDRHTLMLLAALLEYYAQTPGHLR